MALKLSGAELQAMNEMNRPVDEEWDNVCDTDVYVSLATKGLAAFHPGNDRFELTMTGHDFMNPPATNALSVEGIYFMWFSEQGLNTEKTLNEAARHIEFLIRRIHKLEGTSFD